MGQTGAGIHQATDVITSIDSAVTNCWSMYLYATLLNPLQELIYVLAKIQDKHPWFWELKALISERPNMVPVGVGNNSTPINISLPQTPDTSGFGDIDESHFNRESSKDFDTQSEPWTDGFFGASEGPGDNGDEGNEMQMWMGMLTMRVAMKLVMEMMLV
jgi:hypothetical protein